MVHVDMAEAVARADLNPGEVEVWHVYWADLVRRMGDLFSRSDVRARALAYLIGLLSPAERKNSWQLAEISGDPTPYGLQHLLGRAIWDADDLRDRLRTYVTDSLADPGAVGVIDETGFPKKGTHSAGVAPQYSGTVGKVTNCQIGVFLAYASVHGHTLLDRELYLPAEWMADRARCCQAGIPDDRSFLTKPALAQHMLARTFAAGVRLAWVTGDCVYGGDRTLRRWLEDRGQAYVLGITSHETLWFGQQAMTLKTLLATTTIHTWTRLSAGMGSKGARWFDWWRLELRDPTPAGWQRWLVLRRSCTDPHEVHAYLACAPAQTPLEVVVQVVGMRWTVEESFQTAKGEVGLDHYEVRSWTGWYRHITLAMWAHAFLAVIRHERGAPARLKKGLQLEPTTSLAHFKARRGLRSA